MNADVLVIGGGLMGCATAYELAKRGSKVVVAERNAAPGLETTAKSGAIIRAHYGIPELVTLANTANRRYATFAEDVGLPCGWTPSGYAVLVDADDADALRSNVEMQLALGANVSLIGADELKALIPYVRTGDVALIAYEPDAGFANPALTVAAYASRARDLGAQFLFNSAAVTAMSQGMTWTVTLAGGDAIEAGQIALCTGNWSRPVGALFGLDLPVTPVRAQIAVLERPGSFTGLFPVISDLVNLAYFRAEGESGMWVGSSDSADLQEYLPQPEGYNESADAAAVQSARHKAALRFDMGGAENGGVSRAFAALYETTPDWQPIIESCGNVHAAVGFSGHGFKLAPVIGQAMAERIGGLAQSHDVSRFSLSRFAEGRPIQSRVAYRRAKFLR